MNHLARMMFVTAMGFLVVAVATPSLAAPPKPPKDPASITVSVSPKAVSRGGQTEVTVVLRPIQGVKINRYPKIKLEVPGQSGLVDDAEVSVGNASPPPPDAKESNYFDTVDPVQLELRVDASAPVGLHAIAGKLTYYYCVTASGFCAPARVPLKIPVEVR